EALRPQPRAPGARPPGGAGDAPGTDEPWRRNRRGDRGLPAERGPRAGRVGGRGANGRALPLRPRARAVGRRVSAAPCPPRSTVLLAGRPASRLGLGCMRLDPDRADEANAILDAYIEGGGNVFD